MPYKNPEDQRAYAREHYARNKETYKARSVAFRQQIRKELAERVTVIKESSPCTDCQVRYPGCVMQFDHVTLDKVANISDMIADARPWCVIQEEIDKCELVCANCHALRTYSRRQNQ